MKVWKIEYTDHVTQAVTSRWRSSRQAAESRYNRARREYRSVHGREPEIARYLAVEVPSRTAADLANFLNQLGDNDVP